MLDSYEAAHPHVTIEVSPYQLLPADYVTETERDGEPLREDPEVRSKMANLHTEAEVARVMGLKFVTEAVKVEHAAKAGKEFQPPTVPASAPQRKAPPSCSTARPSSS